MFNRIGLLILLCCFPFLLSAQKTSKWGNIPKEDLEMGVYSADTTAGAVVLQDIGSLAFEEIGSGFKLIFSQHRRIKVFDQSAFNEGNLVIPYYSGKRIEKFNDLDVQIFAPDGTKTKVKTDNIFTEKLSKNWSAKKVFVPNLQKGSIIEYRYRIETEDWLSMRPWYFQDPDLPTRWSEFTFEAPEFFQYVSLRKGISHYDVDESNVRTAYYSGSKSTYSVNIRRVGVADQPALKPEPFVTTVDDYRSGIQFQLSRITPPNGAPQPILTSWTELAGKLHEEPQLGLQYERTGKSDRLWADFKTTGAVGQSREIVIQKALQFVSKNIIWDETYGIYCRENIDDAYAKHSGNIAEVNLALVALLRRADIQAYPLLVSTRSNGICYKEYPIVDQFNALVVFVPDPAGGEGGLLLDASSPFHVAGMAQEEIFNGYGWVLQAQSPRWIRFAPPESAEVFMADLYLGEDGALSGHFKLQLTGHLARRTRANLAKMPSGAFLKNRFTDKYPDAVLDSIRIENQDDAAQALKIDFFARFPNAAQVANEFMYCAPISEFLFERNPFQTVKRLYPINFTYPIRSQYILTLHLPEGYTIEELPGNVNLVLPNDGGKIVYTASKQSEQVVQITLRFNLRQLDFYPDEYDTVRLFFDKLTGKMEEQIVLKKS
ncbi:MAG: DUF3857 domain-containing protein [Saprospiraceae bacterium]|nr:DUF3857 domain-containing protein [Saprospiraceae bacterium]